MRLKEAKTGSERELISELFRKDRQILELEKEVENFKFTIHMLEEEKLMYKSLLKEIQEMVNPS